MEEIDRIIATKDPLSVNAMTDDDDDGGTDGNGNNGNGKAISREEVSRIVHFVEEERMAAAMCFDGWSR